MATLVLTAVGTALGGPLGGAIGATIGQLVDNSVLFPPKGREGPRLSDLRLQTSRYGDQIPWMFGSMRVAGSVIWATDLKEQRNKQGGGKGRPSVTTYSYSASFAVALSARRLASVGRIWADGNLLRGSAGDFKTALGAFRLYDGSEDQPLDPLMAALQGAAATPAHRGIAYALFEDLQLADYGNRMPSLTFEIIADAAPVSVAAIAASLSQGAIVAHNPDVTPLINGYAAGGATVGDAISPLFDGLDLALRGDAAGLRIDAVGATEGTVAGDFLCARFNGKVERGFTLTRGRAEDVPVRLSVRHYDLARDYQAGVQTSQRAGPGRKDSNLDLPAVLDAPAARSIAEARMQSLWAGRNGLDLRCDWRALTLQPGSVVTVEQQSGRWRIERSEWEAMAVRLRMKRVGGAGASSPSASSGAAVAQPDALHGSTTIFVADIPAPGDELSAAPLVVVAAAGAQSGWRSAELFVEDSITGGLTSIGATAPSAVMGTASTLPSASASPWLFDDTSVIDVQLLNDQMVLASTDDSALLIGANRALLGREVIQFGIATKTGPSTWRLTHLLRGRRGTEWAMATHGGGERFLLLEPDSLLNVPAPYALMGSTLTIDAIGIGDLTPMRTSEDVMGQAALPLSPAHLHGDLQAGDWQFRWIRRSRSGWRWTDGADAPLGEETENYRIDLMQGGTTFRTATAASEQWTYDAATVAADASAGISGAVTAEIRQIGTHGIGPAASFSFIL